MDPKVILFSQMPLPYSKIGSWSTLYDNYLREANGVDVLICPKPEKAYKDIQYLHFSPEYSFWDKIALKFKWRKPWFKAITALNDLIQPQTKYIIHIIDNYGLCMAVSAYLEKNGIRSNFYIHFFYHGYPVFKNEQLYSKVDELTLLTHKSYTEIKTNVNIFPCRISILHNGIDTSKFYPLPAPEKQDLRKTFQMENKTIFVWCSQDRPKKGLHIILDAWKRIQAQHSNVELLIIGTEKKQNAPGITYIGRVPNNQLARYYQMADVYLFSTLCQEGFGMSLIEAKHSGCYCIASDLGGVAEVLDYGTYGKLIENPNFIEEWVEAIESYLIGNTQQAHFPKEQFSTVEWNRQMNVLIENAKKNML